MPAVDSLPLAVSCVDETNVVVSAVFPSITVAPEMKFVPVRVIEKLPVPVLAGLIPESVGVGFKIVTALDALAELDAALVAVTVSAFGFGSVAGAV
jgi:hypothetical protein